VIRYLSEDAYAEELEQAFNERMAEEYDPAIEPPTLEERIKLEQQTLRTFRRWVSAARRRPTRPILSGRTRASRERVMARARNRVPRRRTHRVRKVGRARARADDGSASPSFERALGRSFRVERDTPAGNKSLGAPNQSPTRAGAVR
jgi:hypothetical protein